MKNIFRKLINSTLVVGTLAVCASCFNFDGDGHRRRGNGHLVSIERGVRPFEKIHSEGSCDIRFYASNEYRVVITVDENLERFVEVYSDNNTLHIDTERGHSYSFTEFTVDVYCPTLSKVSMLGSGSFEGVDAIVARSFEAYLSGSGSVSAGVDCDYFLAKILGSGEVAVGGVCGGAEVTLSGSGDFWGRDLNALETDVEIKGSGDAEVWAEDYLKATIMGSGDIRYRGTPAVDQSIFGSGRVRPM